METKRHLVIFCWLTVAQNSTPLCFATLFLICWAIKHFKLIFCDEKNFTLQNSIFKVRKMKLTFPSLNFTSLNSIRMTHSIKISTMNSRCHELASLLTTICEQNDWLELIKRKPHSTKHCPCSRAQNEFKAKLVRPFSEIIILR